MVAVFPAMVPVADTSSPVVPSTTMAACTACAVPSSWVPRLQTRVRLSADRLDGGVTPLVLHKSGSDLNRPCCSVTLKLTLATGSLPGACAPSLTFTRQMLLTIEPFEVTAGVPAAHSPVIS